MASDLEQDQDFVFVSNFTNSILEVDTDQKKVELFHKLWGAISSLLNKYPKEPSVLEKVCTIFTSSTIYGCLPDSYENSESFVSLFLTTINNYDWSNPPINLVKAVVEVTGSLTDVFEEYLTSDDIANISLLLSRLLNTDTYTNQNEVFAVTAASAFPHGFSDRILYKITQDKVHVKILQLLVFYSNMSEDQLGSILKACLSIIDYEHSVVIDFVQESVHFMILFAAQQFIDSKTIQNPLWFFLTSIIEYAPEIVTDFAPAMIVPILEVVTKPDTIQSVCSFLISYILKSGPLIVDYCFKESQELIRIFIKVLEEPIDTLKCSKETHGNITIVSKILQLFCLARWSHSSIKEVISLNIIPQLGQSAIKCPQCCGSTYCLALNEILPVVMSDGRFSNNQRELSTQFFAHNHLLPFHTLLKASSLPSDKRDLVYATLKHLLKYVPEETIPSWLTKEFLEIYIPAFTLDVTQCKVNGLHQYVFTAHIITFFIKSKELVQVLYDLKFHETAIDVCLTRATYHDGRIVTLNYINCLLRTYQEFIKDIVVFAKSELPNKIIQLALRYGHGQKSPIGDQFSSLSLGLTSDKTASSVLHERGILKKFYPLVSQEFDSVIVRNAIHAVGNIALAGHNVKQEILTDKFQHTLINLIDKNMEQADTSVLTATCRVLHILCSGDWAKREFAEQGLVDILVRLLHIRGSLEGTTPELSWRPLGLLSSICFMSLCNRQYLITDRILASFIDLMKIAKDIKVISYYALVFLACSDIDKRSTIVRKSGIFEKFQDMLQNDALASNNDLKRWGTSLIEKGNLFTLKESAVITDSSDITIALNDSIMWPPSYSLFTDSASGTKLLSDDESQLAAKFPEGSTLTENQLKGLGLTLDHTLFRISRVFGSTHGLCSNCEKEGPSEELVFRPHNLTPNQYQSLIARGWYRRGGVKFFRYRYNHNLDCSDWETRVILSQFDLRKRKSYRKVLRKVPEDNLTIETIPTQFVQEAYDLYNSYHSLKHDKPRKSCFSYCEHVVNSPMRNQTIDGMDYGTFHQMYRLNGKLIAVGVIDVVPNGVVSIYMWYDMSKEVTKLSPGVYSALKEIQYAQELRQRNPKIEYYYLQGWNGNNHKLAYKSNYEPEDFYSPCTVSDWVHGLDGVSQARKEFVKSVDETDDSSVITLQVNEKKESSKKEDSSKKEVAAVSGVALPLDRKWYKSMTGSDTVDTSKLVICLNDKVCMYLSEVMNKYGLTPEQCTMMKDRFEELVFALGPELTSNMVIDLKLC